MNRIIVLIFLTYCISDFTVYSAESDIKNESMETYEVGVILSRFVFEDQSYDNSFMFGVRPIINISKRYAIEGEIGFSSTSFSYGIYSGSLIKENLKVFNYNCDFIYKYALSRSVHSYGTFGAGGISLIPESANSNTNFYFNFGGGIKFLITNDKALRLEIKQYAPSLDIGLFSPRSGTFYFAPDVSPKAKLQKMLQFSIGMSFMLK